MPRALGPLLIGLVLALAARGHATDGPFPPPAPVVAAGLHNVFRVTDRLYSGSGPDGDAGFRALRDLGVKTVLSVDGARPDLDRAKKYGLRYVHLPVGYDGIAAAQAGRLARAVRDLPGPIYLHCHHGKHRGPAAAIAAVRGLDPRCGPADAAAFLARAGTDPRYRGLHAAAAKLSRLTPAELDRVPADFPAAAAVPALAQAMVAVDAHWEHLGASRAAGWKAPPAHPDLDPPHEALQLAEHYREAARLPGRPAGFARWLADAAADAHALEQALRTKQPARAEAAYARSAAACTRCHAQYRDAAGE